MDIASKPKRDPVERTDRLELSSQARARLEHPEAPGAALELSPAPQAFASGTAQERDDRAVEIRRRIQQGYYQREDVVGSIVDALLKTIQEI